MTDNFLQHQYYFVLNSFIENIHNKIYTIRNIRRKIVDDNSTVGLGLRFGPARRG